ncbi:MAG: DNA polymerase II large subunit [Archaeoglobaceae archaeon]|nr:DNA polymerase II large subunit [Archaeoglobaceae archaeon]
MYLTLDKFFQLFEDEKRSYLKDEIKKYHENLLEKLYEAYNIAEKARSLGLDPETFVEIPVAKNMAERVEKLIGIPVSNRIIELESMNLSREKICFSIADDIIDGKFGNFSKEDILDKAVRTAVAIMTEGVVAAPIEGIAKVKIWKDDFVKIYYAGPIRSAGGTAQVISVLVADYVRRKIGIGKYLPKEEEILRYCEEIQLYKKVANLQYLPSDDEIKLIVSNCPICIDGEPTEDVEVSGYRNLPRVETNRVRGGMALVIAEGIALKAPKLKKIVDSVKLDGWEWLDKLIKAESSEEVKPRDKYLSDMVAGRPVLSHPSRKGGFRIRYGRARNSGLATVGINPATMVLLDFIAVGTQLKIELPGKAASVVPVSTIEGPTVRLKNGDVLKINSVSEAKTVKNEVDLILDLGEILINFGDFLENNFPLIPASYCYEWWIQEVEGKISGDLRKISEDDALKLCDEYNLPLHPDHTYLWHDIEMEELEYLRDHISKNGKIEGKLSKLFFPFDAKAKSILEKLLVEHKVRDGNIILEKWKVLIRCLGLDRDLKKVGDVKGKDVLDAVRNLSGLDVRAKAICRIGARMGRPEKAKERKMSPPPHILFPVGLAGGKTRDLKNAINYTKDYNSPKGEIEVELAIKRCKECGKETFWIKCECGGATEQVYYCSKCKTKVGDELCKCGEETKPYYKRTINIRELYEKASSKVGNAENVKGVIGMTSKYKIPEKIEKGILRAKYEVYVFKDGTCRYDMTDLPLTHFKPKEIGLSVEKLKELDYRRDYLGREIKSDDQIVELKPQDIILPRDAANYLLKVSKFIDDLLLHFYGLEPYYRAEKPEDLIGHLVIGLAPHTSAGVLGRIIGFSDFLACYAHPYFHAAKRRNCDGDEDSVMLLLDGLLNFSRKFLPEKRGGQMDAPLVLTAIVDPREVDKEVHNMDVVDRYPLKFYEATLRYANPKDLADLIEKVSDRLKKDERFYGLKFTHDTCNITEGNRESAYKYLEKMQDKLKAQMELAKKIAAVDADDVAERVINIHFLPDIVGNLRAFSRQEFRCLDCNTKYRRLPLSGKCLKCGGKIALTVHSSSITKYLELSKMLCEEFKVSEYTKQRIKLVELEIKSLFESDTKKQISISDFF